MNVYDTLPRSWHRAIFSNRLYRTAIQPFSRVLFEQVATADLAAVRRKSLPLNKLCQVADLHHPAWRQTASDLKIVMREADFHRKDWEHTQILHALRQLRLLTPKSVCLAVGAGREPLLYYLTYKVRKVVGVDLYEGKFRGGEDEEDVPLSAERYAPFPYVKDRLELQRMDARSLAFPANSFDFAFSASSIEHFGSLKDIRRALREMCRVLKPGGVAAITTELHLTSLGSSPPGVRPFFYEELLDLISEAGFERPADCDLRIEREYFDDWIKLPQELTRRPHVILRFFRTVFTSVHLVLKKAGDQAWCGDESPAVVPDYEHRGRIQAALDATRVQPGDEVGVTIALDNTGNFNWIHSGHSHRIAIGVKLLSAEREQVNRDFASITLPRDVGPGESVTFHAAIPAPPAAGSWILRFDLKRELVCWFSERGSPPYDLSLVVV